VIVRGSVRPGDSIVNNFPDSGLAWPIPLPALARFAPHAARRNIVAMNKAFVREPDIALPDPVPELPLPPPPNPVTEAGHRLILAAIEAIDRRLAGQADLVEGSELDRLQRERRYWAARLATARVTLPPSDPDEIGFGSEVTLGWPARGRVTLRIVGEDEAAPAQGLIAWRAPVAAALIGNGTGDSVPVTLARGEVRLAVQAVKNQPAKG